MDGTFSKLWPVEHELETQCILIEDETQSVNCQYASPSTASRGLEMWESFSVNGRKSAMVGLGLLVCAALLGFAILYHLSTTSGDVANPAADDTFVQLQSVDAPVPTTLVESSREFGKLQSKPNVAMIPDFAFNGPVIDVNSLAPNQEIFGFGGAFTESSAVVFNGLNPQLQEQLLEQYFGVSGIGYTLGRVHINSCDFSKSSYSFDDKNDDFQLLYFDHDVKRDAAALIPLIGRAKQKVEATGQQLRILATPWSPPAWMKTNGKMDTSTAPCLREGMEETWARYIATWITAYAAHQIPIWAITVQNEPQAAVGWEACLFTPQQEAEFLGTYLGPILRSVHPEVAIFVNDFNKDIMYSFASTMYQHPTASQYTDGVAFHWYTGDHFEGVEQVHKEFPMAALLATEATYEKYRWQKGSAQPPPDWGFGEGYAHDIIGDINAGASGWIDWNLLLDANGGPNHVGNMCDAAMVGDTEKQLLHVHPQYYFIGHFSKFVPPGSKHLTAKVWNSIKYTGPPRPYGTCTGDDGLEAVAFLRPDQRVATIVLNCADTPADFKIRSGASAIQANIPAHGIQTYVFTPGPPMAGATEWSQR